jgi:mRNA interferase MazF
VEVVGPVEIQRGDVLLVNLDPARGSEIRKTRPCVVISPNELNDNLSTCIVAPMTTGGHTFPFRVGCRFKGKSGHIVLDQLRTIERDRVVRLLGRVPEATLGSTLSVLQEMFSP